MTTHALQTHFPTGMYDMLEEAEAKGHSHIVSWIQGGRSFRIHQEKMMIPILKSYFCQTKYKSFLRQLQTYGFTRVTRGDLKGIVSHPLLIRGKRFLCLRMKRKVRTPKRQDSLSSVSSSTHSTASSNASGGTSGGTSQRSQLGPDLLPSSSCTLELKKKQQNANNMMNPIRRASTGTLPPSFSMAGAHHPADRLDNITSSLQAAALFDGYNQYLNGVGCGGSSLPFDKPPQQQHIPMTIRSGGMGMGGHHHQPLTACRNRRNSIATSAPSNTVPRPSASAARASSASTIANILDEIDDSIYDQFTPSHFHDHDDMGNNMISPLESFTRECDNFNEEDDWLKGITYEGADIVLEPEKFAMTLPSHLSHRTNVNTNTTLLQAQRLQAQAQQQQQQFQLHFQRQQQYHSGTSVVSMDNQAPQPKVTI